MKRIWWCAPHNCLASPDPYGVKLEGEAPDECYEQVWGDSDKVDGLCRMVERILASPDSIIIERQDGGWPRSLVAFIASELSYPRIVSDIHELKALRLLDSLAEWSQSR